MSTYTDTGLCIGGPLDGQRRPPPPTGTRMIITEQIRGSTLVRAGEFRRVSYESQMFRGENATYRLWALEGMTGDEIMEKLFSGYRSALTPSPPPAASETPDQG